MSWFALLAEPAAVTGCGLVALLVAGYLLRVHVALRYGLACLAVFYFWFATPLGANVMVAALETDTQASGRCGGDEKRPVIVVLAGGKSGSPNRPEEFSRLQEAGYRRTIVGTQLAQRMPGSLLIMSGGSGTGDVREADLMRALAVAVGIPAERVVAERHSRTTYESGVEVARMLRASSTTHVLLVTSALHMRRSAAVFEAQGVRVCPYAMDSKWLRPRLREMWIPQISALAKSTTAVHEAVGWAWYWVSGRFKPQRNEAVEAGTGVESVARCANSSLCAGGTRNRWRSLRSA